jgi:Protein of unknown function (DUF3237)
MTKPPELVPLFHMELEVGTPAVVFGSMGTRAPVALTGGTFTGERLSGTVLPTGLDWLLIDGNGIWHIDVRAALVVDGGPVVATSYTGRVRLPEGGLERYMGGEPLAADEIYFRSAPTFETEPGDYDWLNAVQAIGVGSLAPGRVIYDVFEVT